MVAVAYHGIQCELSVSATVASALTLMILLNTPRNAYLAYLAYLRI